MAGLSYSEALALVLIHRGVDTVRDLARAMDLDPREVEEIVGSLETKGLVERVVEGRILKRERLRLTRRGLDAVPEAMRLLREAAAMAREAAEAARRGEPVAVDQALLPLLPGLAFLDLLPLWALTILLAGSLEPWAPAWPPEEAPEDEAGRDDYGDPGDAGFDADFDPGLAG